MVFGFWALPAHPPCALLNHSPPPPHPQVLPPPDIRPDTPRHSPRFVSQSRARAAEFLVGSVNPSHPHAPLIPHLLAPQSQYTPPQPHLPNTNQVPPVFHWPKPSPGSLVFGREPKCTPPLRTIRSCTSTTVYPTPSLSPRSKSSIPRISLARSQICPLGAVLYKPGWVEPGRVDVPLILDQLRCNGVLEGIKLLVLVTPIDCPSSSSINDMKFSLLASSHMVIWTAAKHAFVWSMLWNWISPSIKLEH